jgi:hypothetical protein
MGYADPVLDWSGEVVPCDATRSGSDLEEGGDGSRLRCD